MTSHPYETEDLPFDRMKEADVRAHVLDPLLRWLGYSLNGQATILREHTLKYTDLYLGRKKPGKDLKLQGNADYTLEVSGHVSPSAFATRFIDHHGQSSSTHTARRR